MQARLSDNWDLLKDEAELEWPGILGNELQWVDGEEERLVAVVQPHYGLTRPEATKRVRDFIERGQL